MPVLIILQHLHKSLTQNPFPITYFPPTLPVSRRTLMLKYMSVVTVSEVRLLRKEFMTSIDIVYCVWYRTL